jgi:hypothetical protein
MGIILVLYGWLLRPQRISHRSGFGRKLDTFSVTIWAYIAVHEDCIAGLYCVYNQCRQVLKYELCPQRAGSVQNIEHTHCHPYPSGKRGSAGVAISLKNGILAGPWDATTGYPFEKDRR